VVLRAPTYFFLSSVRDVPHLLLAVHRDALSNQQYQLFLLELSNDVVGGSD
jgi:hypothetical protein